MSFFAPTALLMAKVAQGVRPSTLGPVKATKTKNAAKPKAKGAAECKELSNKATVMTAKGNSKAHILQMLDGLRDNCKASMEASADVFSANIKLFCKVLECQASVKSMTVIHEGKIHKNKK